MSFIMHFEYISTPVHIIIATMTVIKSEIIHNQDTDILQTPIANNFCLLHPLDIIHPIIHMSFLPRGMTLVFPNEVVLVKSSQIVVEMKICP